MSRFHEPSIYDRSHGPAPGAGADGLEGAYSATLVAAPSNGTVKVLIPALDAEHFYLATCSPAFGGVPGDSVLVVLDEGKHGWVVSPRSISLLTDANFAAANKDGIASTPSLRTLGTGSQQALPGNFHTNTVARAHRAAALSLTNNIFNKIPLDTKDFDPGSNFDVATNHRYNVPTAGYYQGNGQVSVQGITANTGGDVLAAIFKNGTLYSAGIEPNPVATTFASVVSDIIQCAAGDFLELFVYVFTGTSTPSLYFQTPASASNYLSVVRAA